MTPAEVLDILIKNLGMNPKTFSEALGFDRPQAIYDILNGKPNLYHPVLQIRYYLFSLK